jgi:predicted ATPase
MAVGVAWRGWALTQLNRVEEGIAQMLEGTDPYGAIGQGVAISQLLGLLAEGYLTCGQLAPALDTIERALSKAQNTGEHFFEAELHRIKGRTLLSQPDPPLDAVRACFERAIAVARSQNSKSYELRAALDLARLLRDEGKTREARDLVAGIYGWVTEGFDTPDLKDAKTLLSQLS